jgi:hypothetical protein
MCAGSDANRSRGLGQLSRADVERFLADLTHAGRLAPKSRNQASAALAFFFREILAGTSWAPYLGPRSGSVYSRCSPIDRRRLFSASLLESTDYSRRSCTGLGCP